MTNRDITDALGLPNQWNDLETQEKLTALANVANTTNGLTNELSIGVFGGNFPPDLRDYAMYLIHDSNRDIGNLRNWITRGETNTATWRSMYNCLHWIQHIEVLLELYELREGGW
jgi:hypothetical protein